jgi:hypothetical protein
VRFPPTGRAEIPDAIRERCNRVYALQAADRERLRATVPELIRRLDLTTGVLTAMTCDHRFALLLENWAASCDRAGIDCRESTVVFPTDPRAHAHVETLGFVSYFDAESRCLSAMTDSAIYGDHAWTAHMFHQNWVIANLLELPADVLFQDVDLIWRKDPRPFLVEQANAGADIQAMYDGPNSRFQPLYANSGFMYLRNSNRVRSFWAEVYARHEMVAYYHSQQQPLNVLLATYAHRGLDVRILDEERFANGHRYCGGRTPPPDPWVVHNSWTADLAEKRRRYEANDLWFLDRGR